MGQFRVGVAGACILVNFNSYTALFLLCAAGGCGTQNGLAPAGPESGLAPGIYTGGGSGTMVISGTMSESEQVAISAPPSIEISQRGIPIVDGHELRVGDVFLNQAGGFYIESTIRSVSVSSDGVRVRLNQLMVIDIPEGSAVLTGSADETYKRIASGTIEWQRSGFISGLAESETVSITISTSGLYSR